MVKQVSEDKEGLTIEFNEFLLMMSKENMMEEEDVQEAVRWQVELKDFFHIIPQGFWYRYGWNTFNERFTTFSYYTRRQNECKGGGRYGKDSWQGKQGSYQMWRYCEHFGTFFLEMF